jgi:hypothetical protein
MSPLYTIEQIAEHFGLSPEQVVRKCQSPINAWPHLRPIERKSSSWRFTEADVADIEARIASRMVDTDSWGRTGKKAS